MRPPNLQVSIIIVVKNDRGVASTLGALYKTQAGSTIQFETIIIDSSAPDRLADIRKQYPQVRWEQFPPSSRRTVPEQRNRGLELARSNIIIFIDANCIPDEGWLSAITSKIQGGEAIVCGPVRDLNRGNLVHYNPEHTAGRYVEVCTTINVGLKREVVERIGGFDTSFSFGQDIDFFWRARDAGYKIYFNPAASIGHDWGEAGEQMRRAYDYGKARAHLYKKHWLTRRRELQHEPHVWLYPLFILGLPLMYIIPWYPLLLLVPMAKNVHHNPVGLIVHHLSYGWGVLVGALKVWPKGDIRISLED
jgi:glycosyltransferase involved in cell wall biosynthesis